MVVRYCPAVAATGVARSPFNQSVDLPRERRLLYGERMDLSPSHLHQDRGLKRHQRLIHSDLFDEAFNQGCRAAGRYMVIWLRRGEGASLRLGVVTSRKVGGAVQRVKARRRLREMYRLNRGRLAGECDMVIVARREILNAQWKDIESEFLKLAERVGLRVDWKSDVNDTSANGRQ